MVDRETIRIETTTYRSVTAASATNDFWPDGGRRGPQILETMDE
jgi:hypothetical protein